MALRDAAIIAYAETKIVQRSDKHAWELGAEVLEEVLESAGCEKSEIDGVLVGGAAAVGANNMFWPQVTADELGLEVDFCEGVYLGGCTGTAAVARAAAALDAGLCTTALLLFTDTPSKAPSFRANNEDRKWTDLFGVMGPPAFFGLLTKRYEHQFGLDYRMLGKLAVTQREHACLNDNACEKFRTPITVEDYLNSRMIADPIRLLDCVMPCDGASALLMTTRKRAVQKKVRSFVVPIGYGERSNYQVDIAIPDVTETGHAIAGRRALASAGLKPADVGSFHPYDDFLIAMVMQFEMFGFCAHGQGIDFVRDHDFRFSGEIPLNTGGGQISAGQAACCSVNLIEGVRQLLGGGGARQVRNTANALVTGIGWINYVRNWGSSTALVLVPDA